MWKRTVVLFLMLSLFAAFLVGCQSAAPTLSETTVPSTEPHTRPAVTEETEDRRLTDFDGRLKDQGAATLEEFRANYEQALALYQAGLRPQGAMPSYAPSQGQAVPGDFYFASLDPDTYGVSKFFVLPAGERALTAEEYLELAEASGQMAAADLVLTGNSWLSTQEGREEPLASRGLYRSESFWLSYILGMYYEGRTLPAEERTIAALYLPLPVENAVFTLYPTDHLSPQGLLADGMSRLERASGSAQAKYIPPEDTDYEALRSAAILALQEHTNITEDPAAVYFAFTDTTSPSAETRSYSWTVGLLYSGGASYTVRLDGPELTLMTIEQLSDGALDISGNWEALDEPQLEHNYIYNG